MSKANTPPPSGDRDKEEAQEFFWTDKTVQVPKGLLIRGATGEAAGCYAKMKGFGAEVRCSLEALAVRLGWSPAKARKYQNELWELRWIWLLREGEGAKPGQKGMPRRWWMAANAGDQPPQDLVERVCKNGTLPPQIPAREGHGFQEALGFSAPLKPVPEANKGLDLKANKEPPIKQDPAPKSADSSKHPEQDAFWSKATTTWAAKFPGAKLNWPGAAGSPPIKDFQKILTGQLQNLGAEGLAQRWSNCVNDPFSRPSLRAFIYDVDRWIQKRDGGALPGKARPFNTPPPDGWTPSAHAIPRTQE